MIRRAVQCVARPDSPVGWPLGGGVNSKPDTREDHHDHFQHPQFNCLSFSGSYPGSGKTCHL
jgi:hypothetical protein